MINMIRGEIFKILHSKVLAGISIALGFFILIQGGIIVYLNTHSKVLAEMGESKITGMDALFDGSSGNILYIVLGVFVTILVCTEYSTGSIRQIVSRGIKRNDILLGKYVSMVLVSCILFAVYFLCLFLIGTIFGGIGVIDHEIIRRFILFAVGCVCMIIGYVGVSILIAFLLKSSGISIATNVLFIICGSIVIQLLQYVFKNKQISNYWLPNMSGAFGTSEVSGHNQVVYMGIFLVIAAVTVFASMLIFNKRDVD